MYNLKQNQIDSMLEQWNNMLTRGIMPIMEYQTGECDYLIVNIELHHNKRCMWFEFNIDPVQADKVYFSDDVKPYNRNRKINHLFKIYVDPCFNDIDAYLQQINDEIVEGYLLPNDLYYCEED